MNRPAKIRLAALALAGALACGPAWAWNNQGHMATGEIAYDALLPGRPDVVARVLAIAAALPRRERLDAALARAPEADRARLTFAYLARWPDDIRRTPLDRPTHHYRIRAVSPIGALVTLRNGDADSAYAAAVAALRDRRTSPEDRAIALAWVFHLVGDMQQPLHAATWLSLRFPATDRAGTTGYVRPPGGGEPVSLHEFWDSAADRRASEESGARAISLAAEEGHPRAALPELGRPSGDFGVWADESADLARRQVYRDGRMIPGATPASAPRLSPSYVAEARSLAERRIALGGYRLADVLQAALAVPAR